jgi:hypothetical protein
MLITPLAAYVQPSSSSSSPPTTSAAAASVVVFVGDLPVLGPDRWYRWSTEAVLTITHKMGP